MKILEDALGQDLRVGDQIVYTTRRGSHMNIRRAVIKQIVDNGVEQNHWRYELVIYAWRKRWNGEIYHYNTRLYSNNTLVRINSRKNE